MGTQDDYTASVTDQPTRELTLRIGSSTKRVIDYAGIEVGMPASVRALEEAVDRLAGTERWVRGNSESIEYLQQQEFDLGSGEAAELIRVALDLNRRGSDLSAFSAFLSAAVEAGLDLDLSVNTSTPGENPFGTTIGYVLMRHATENGDEALFKFLVDKGYLARMSQKDLNDAFGIDLGCSPEIARALVAAGADPLYAGPAGNALHGISSGVGPCSNVAPEERVEMTRTLIELGVSPTNRRIRRDATHGRVFS
ncbi:MAG: hypothetical protein R3C04_09370 [Hyphomonas sp.]